MPLSSFDLNKQIFVKCVAYLAHSGYGNVLILPLPRAHHLVTILPSDMSGLPPGSVNVIVEPDRSQRNLLRAHEATIKSERAFILATIVREQSKSYLPRLLDFIDERRCKQLFVDRFPPSALRLLLVLMSGKGGHAFI